MGVPFPDYVVDQFLQCKTVGLNEAAGSATQTLPSSDGINLGDARLIQGSGRMEGDAGDTEIP